jgi:hypothetical protein
MLIFRRIYCIHAAYDTVTLYESTWWPVGAQCARTDHHELLLSHLQPLQDTDPSNKVV